MKNKILIFTILIFGMASCKKESDIAPNPATNNSSVNNIHTLARSSYSYPVYNAFADIGTNYPCYGHNGNCLPEVVITGRTSLSTVITAIADDGGAKFFGDSENSAFLSSLFPDYLITGVADNTYTVDVNNPDELYVTFIFKDGSSIENVAPIKVE